MPSGDLGTLTFLGPCAHCGSTACKGHAVVYTDLVFHSPLHEQIARSVLERGANDDNYDKGSSSS